MNEMLSLLLYYPGLFGFQHQAMHLDSLDHTNVIWFYLAFYALLDGIFISGSFTAKNNHVLSKI